MALSFGSGLDGPLRRNATPLSYGTSVPQLNTGSNGFGWLDWGADVYDNNLGTPIQSGNGWSSPYTSPPVDWSGRPGAGGPDNTANTDGGSDFFSNIANLGNAVLANAGVQSERQNPMVQRASYDPGGMGQVGGVNVSTIAVVGLVGAGIYLAFRN